MTVAEIGSGWGGFAIHLARETGARVTAVNVSPEQIKIARASAEAAGVSDRLSLLLLINAFVGGMAIPGQIPGEGGSVAIADLMRLTGQDRDLKSDTQITSRLR